MTPVAYLSLLPISVLNNNDGHMTVMWSHPIVTPYDQGFDLKYYRKTKFKEHLDHVVQSTSALDILLYL